MKKLLIFALLFVLNCSQQTGVDLILTNANVISLNPQKPHAQLIAIKNHKIHFVGKNSDLEKFRSPSTKIIDLQGKTVIPGFIDAPIC